MGQARKPLKTHVAWERWKVHLCMEKEGVGLGVQLLPLGVPLGLGGLATMPLHLYIEERDAPKRTHKPLAPSLPLLRNSSIFVVLVALGVALTESLHHHHHHAIVFVVIPSTYPLPLAGSRRRR